MAAKRKRCRHTWLRVLPVVRVIGDEEPIGPTHNAVCSGCQATAWLHWPPLSRAA